MDIHAQTFGMEAFGICNAVRAVEKIACRLRMQDGATIWLQRFTRGDQQRLDIFLFHAATADPDFYRADFTSEACS